MHPARSVIYFTVMSGLGYGLVVWLGVYALTDHNLPAMWNAGALTLALALIGSGLVSSTAHLGHPERAWRALSQWRTSWLSREGVAAIVTFVPLGLWWLAWITAPPAQSIKGALGAEAALVPFAMLGSVVTVVTTAMIYASLKAVPAWYGLRTPLAYVSLSLYSGLVIFMTLLAVSGADPAPVTRYAYLFLAVAAGAKALYWWPRGRAVTASDATGIAGDVRLFEAPHTSANYLMREMGFVIARKHARKLRRWVWALLFAVPLAGVLCLDAGVDALVMVPVAVAMMVGLFIERWLFFAEAQHTVSLYYGNTAVTA